MSAVDDKPLTEKEALRFHRKVWERAGCSSHTCGELEVIATHYAEAMGIPVQDGLLRVTDIVLGQLELRLNNKVVSTLEPY